MIRDVHPVIDAIAHDTGNALGALPFAPADLTDYNRPKRCAGRSVDARRRVRTLCAAWEAIVERHVQRQANH